MFDGVAPPLATGVFLLSLPLLQPVAQPLTKLLTFCKECANCRNESKCGQKTLLVLRTSDGTNLVKLVKCPKGGGRCSTENQFQAWVSSGLFGNSPIWGACLELCVRQRLLNKIRIRTEGSVQVPHRMDVPPHPEKQNQTFTPQQPQIRSQIWGGKNATRGDV